MNKIPVVFAINDRYVVQLSVVIASIVKNHKGNLPLEFNILNSDISENNKNNLLKLESLKPNVKINFIDIRQYTKPEILEKYLSVRENYSYITVETYFRFFIPDIFADYSKILYLDADILVLDDVEKLFDEDIENNYVGAVEDVCIKSLVVNEKYKTSLFNELSFVQYFNKKLKKKTNKYFNAGVMLMNLDKIRKDDKVRQLWNFVAENSPLEFQDQDVLNVVFEGNIKYLDYKWNILHNTFKYAKRLSKREQTAGLVRAARAPAIYHYAGGDAKPWQLQKKIAKFSYIKEWWTYFENTPFYSAEHQLLKGYHDLYMTRFQTDNIFCIKIFNFKFIEIMKIGSVLRFEFFNLLKFNIK